MEILTDAGLSVPAIVIVYIIVFAIMTIQVKIK